MATVYVEFAEDLDTMRDEASTMTELERRVTELVNLILAEDRVATNDITEGVLHWDSLSHLSIIAALEQEFAVRISPEESRKLRTIPSICAFLSKAT